MLLIVFNIAAVCVLSILYVWVLYNIPVLLVGIRSLRKSRGPSRTSAPPKHSAPLPKISILLPMKNEEKVASRVLESIHNLNYPENRREIIIVEDGSTDGTLKICENYAKDCSGQVKLVHRSKSNGKPAALNHGLKYATGDVVAVFDADSVLDRDVLLKAVGYFEDASISAVQGRTLAINADENMLTKIASFEETGRFDVYFSGKDQLHLYLPLSGNCQFIRKHVLEKIGGWDEESLCEDVEMSARLTEKGYGVKYASDVKAWQEHPQSLRQIVKQRLRWYRGWLDVAAKYGRLMLKPSRKTFDAEVTLMLPFLLPVSLLLLPLSILSFTIPFPTTYTTIILATTLLNALLPLLVAGGFFLLENPRRNSFRSWMGWMYLYWLVHLLTASYALLRFLLRKPKEWRKTVKTGAITTHEHFVPG